VRKLDRWPNSGFEYLPERLDLRSLFTNESRPADKQDVMNIKSTIRAILPSTVQATRDLVRARTGESADRDPNGQQPGQEQEKKRELTPEQIKEAIQYLENLPGVKDNHLTVRLDMSDGTAVVFIEDPTGKVVRRIPQSELGSLTADREKKSGHLLSKSA
jgi:uncharacterized FlaG/YvyC family protein